VKTTHSKNAEKHILTFEGRKDEFDMLIDALENSHDNNVRLLAAYVRKAVGNN
jgi:hypothetical protein